MIHYFRLGQTKQVTVYRLICKGTIEERILQRAREKSEIQRMVIQGGSFKGFSGELKQKEVVSLLLDDEELERKYNVQKSTHNGNGTDETHKQHTIIEEPSLDIESVAIESSMVKIILLVASEFFYLKFSCSAICGMEL